MSTLRHYTSLGPEWDRAVLALGLSDKQLPLRIARTMSNTAHRAAGNAQGAILKMPVHGSKHRGTRGTVARGVRVRSRGGGQRITTSMPNGMEALPRGFQSQWGHPVYGHGWVMQAPHYDWFFGPISSEYDNAVRGLHRDLENQAQFVANMTNGR